MLCRLVRLGIHPIVGLRERRPVAMRRAGAEGCDAVPVVRLPVGLQLSGHANRSRSDFAPARGFFTHRGGPGGTFTALHAPPPATLPLIPAPVTRPEKRRVTRLPFTRSVTVKSIRSPTSRPLTPGPVKR